LEMFLFKIENKTKLDEKELLKESFSNIYSDFFPLFYFSESIKVLNWDFFEGKKFFFADCVLFFSRHMYSKAQGTLNKKRRNSQTLWRKKKTYSKRNVMR